MRRQTTLGERLKHRPIFNPDDLWSIYSQRILLNLAGAAGLEPANG
jgi:hypothetical protein